uniref:Uncharacterized protein n=1 Tax=Hucho hucho TaxID=62062 RepID=A0A4W5MH57_9TELE
SIQSILNSGCNTTKCGKIKGCEYLLKALYFHVCSVHFSDYHFLCSGEPVSVYLLFKWLGTELVLGLFLNVNPDETPELFQDITALCTLHWHGIISAPVSVKWSSGFCTALEAKDKLEYQR